MPRSAKICANFYPAVVLYSLCLFYFECLHAFDHVVSGSDVFCRMFVTLSYFTIENDNIDRDRLVGRALTRSSLEREV